ncbi:Poxvirus D5 protein-like protein family protein, partial [human gut metagenome]
KQAFDTLYKIARQSQMKEIQGKYTVIGKQLYNAETGLFEEITPEIIVTRKIKTGYNPVIFKLATFSIPIRLISSC